MHEMPVTQSLLNMALSKAEQAGANRILELHLVIGDLSTFVDDSISFYWDMLSEGTIAEGSSLHFHRVPAEMHCLDCQQAYQPEPGELLCPSCQGAHLEIRAGDEFQLESIVIDEDESAIHETEVVG